MLFLPSFRTGARRKNPVKGVRFFPKISCPQTVAKAEPRQGISTARTQRARADRRSRAHPAQASAAAGGAAKRKAPAREPGGGGATEGSAGEGLNYARRKPNRETARIPRPRHHAGGRGRRAADGRGRGGQPPPGRNAARPATATSTAHKAQGAEHSGREHRKPKAPPTAAPQPPGRVRRARECAAEAPSTAQAQGPGAMCRTRAVRRISLFPTPAERQRPR